MNGRAAGIILNRDACDSLTCQFRAPSDTVLSCWPNRTVRGRMVVDGRSGKNQGDDDSHTPQNRRSPCWPELAVAAALAFSIGVLGRSVSAQQPAAPAPGSARAMAPIDLTGNWVSIVTEDWRFRMVTPPKGDYASVPLNAAARAVADAWDPAKDTAAGNACKSYGAAGLMRVPGRLHISWQDDTTLKIDTDAGTQTRLLHFAGTPGGDPSWQGYSAANWEFAGGFGGGGGGARGGGGGVGRRGRGLHPRAAHAAAAAVRLREGAR